MKEGLPQPENSPERELGIEKLPTGASVRFTKGEGGEILPAILMVHGWHSKIFAEQGVYALSNEMITKNGFHSLALSLRGHEHSDGDMNKVTREEHFADIESAIEYLKQRPEVDSSKIGAFGTSYGAYLLSNLSPDLPIGLLALRAPALYPDEGMGEPAAKAVYHPDLSEWRKSEHSKDDSATMEAISHFTGDLLIVRSEKDEDMPPEITEGYVHSASNAKSVISEVIKDAHHRLNETQQGEFVGILENWLKTHRL